MMNKTMMTSQVGELKVKDPQESITLAMISEFEISEAAEIKATVRAASAALKAGMSEEDVLIIFGLTISQVDMCQKEVLVLQGAHA